MAYTPATKLPPLTFFSWSRPEAPNPRLAAPIDIDDTTLTFTYAPKDRSGVVITGNFLMNCTNEAGFTEMMYFHSGGMSVDGLTATGVIRGVRISGLDYTTGSASFADVHEGDSPVGCAVNAVYQAILAGVLTGTVATNGTSVRMGTEADATVTLTFAGITDKGFLRRNHTLNKVQFSNDGATWTNIDSVSSSNLVAVSVADTTPAYLSDKLVSATGGIDFNILNAGGNETLNLTVDLSEADVIQGALANICSDVTSTAAELNKLSGASANVTAANLNTLTAGAASDASALHAHTTAALSYTGIAGEAINGSVTPQVVAVAGTTFKKALRIETAADQMNYGAVPANVTIGGVDANTRVAQSFSYTDADAEAITIEQINLMVGIANAPGEYLHIMIETDNADKPSNTVIPNGTSNVLGTDAAISETSKFNLRAFTFATPPTIVSGTKYWMVVERCDAAGAPRPNNAGNYYAWACHGSSLYAGHGYSTQTGSTTVWAAASVNDMYFDMRLNCNYNGQTFLADSNNLSKSKVVGMTSSNVADAGAPAIQYGGIITMAGLTPGASYYVDATAGGITAAPTTGLDTCLIPIGRAVSTTQLLIDPGIRMAQYEIDTLSFTSDNSGGAGVNVQTFIELGFKPSFISIRALWSGGAGQTGAGSVEWVYNSMVPGLTLNAETSWQTITAQTSGAVDYSAVGGGSFTDLGFNNADYIDVGTIYENGFNLRVVSDDITHSFRKIHVLAYGY